MFTEYFAARSIELRQALDANLARTPGKPGQKDVQAFREFFTFLKEHLPDEFAVVSGRLRGKKHLLNKPIDLLIYDRWCQRFLEMMGGNVLVDAAFAALTFERDLTTQGVVAHVALSNAVKSLFQISTEAPENQVVPLFSILVSYGSRVPLISHRTAIRDAARERSVPVTMEPDMVCILDQGLIIKDWENGGEYKVVETGADTLMWLYVLLLEYVDRNGTMKYQLRNYIRSNKSYKEY